MTQSHWHTLDYLHSHRNTAMLTTFSINVGTEVCQKTFLTDTPIACHEDEIWGAFMCTCLNTVFNTPQWCKTINLSHKSHNALVLYPTMHHFVTEMCTFLLQNGALWDICLMHCGIREISLSSVLYPLTFITDTAEFLLNKCTIKLNHKPNTWNYSWNKE